MCLDPLNLIRLIPAKEEDFQPVMGMAFGPYPNFLFGGTEMDFCLFKRLEEKTPLIHCITNYVTVNDCANILLACKASPIMADDEQEVEDITSICTGLTINIGTLNSRTIDSMMKAGKKARSLGHTVLLDPVGAGASALRTETAVKLMDEIDFTVIRGNISEVKTLALGSGKTRGVDANDLDKVTDENLESVASWAKELSKRTGAVIAITGAIDIAADGDKAIAVRNGCSMMGMITGSGCMLSAFMEAAVAAMPEERLWAVTQALCAMGVAGELAYDRMKAMNAGNSTFRNLLIDEIFNMTDEKLEKGARYEII